MRLQVGAKIGQVPRACSRGARHQTNREMTGGGCHVGPTAQSAQPFVAATSAHGRGSNEERWPGIFLGVAFGPLGLLYSTVVGAIIMFLVNVLVGLVTLGFGLFLTWPICGLWAYFAAKSHNEKLLAGQRQF